MPDVIIDGVRYVPAPAATADASTLDFVFVARDIDETVTVREYLRRLLSTLWAEGEGFSGKRPFGNSCWEYSLYEAVVRAGKVEGTFDEDGCLDDFDRDAANKLIFELIDTMCAAPVDANRQ